MAHGDAQVGKRRGNLRMEWVASTLHTTSEHGVSSITIADAPTSAASSRLNWHPRRFKWTRPFRLKRKCGCCACTITFQTQSTTMTWSATCYRLFRAGFGYRHGQEKPSPWRPDGLSCPHSPLFNWYLGAFHGIRRPKREVDHSHAIGLCILGWADLEVVWKVWEKRVSCHYGESNRIVQPTACSLYYVMLPQILAGSKRKMFFPIANEM